VNEAIEQILELGFLGAIAREDLLSLRPAPSLLSVKTGETLLWEGEGGEAYYLLLRGRLRRFVDGEHGGRRFAGDVVPGQGVGSSGLLSAGGNAATVRVMHDSEVVRFPRAAFLQMMVLSWEFAIGVSREQIERVRAAVAPEGRHATIKSIAVVPLDATVGQESFVGHLAEAIGSIASVATIDRTLIDAPTEPSSKASGAAQPSPGTAGTDAVVSHLEAFERGHDIVLYPVSSVVDTWTHLILARADLVLLVTSVGGASDLCGIETALIDPTEDELLPRIDLVVMHGDDWTPDCGTRKWLDVRHVDEWHHLRTGHQEDFQRLARVLTGNAITLVLGGGGARGLAEIGVVRALLEAGIPFDRLAGTSMGALIGGLLASGKDPDEVSAALRTWAEKGRPGRDYTFPALALVHGKKLHQATHDALGDGNIEDLPIPFFCVSADLSENRAVIHDRGLLWRSIRASISVPGIGPPLFDDGRILVDGGTVNNVPADIVATRHAGRIILVDVSIPRKFGVPASYNDLVPSGWQILWHRINPFLETLQVPGIYEVMARSTTIGSRASYRKARELADLAIHPPVSGVPFLDYRSPERLVDIGYEYAVTQLASIGEAALRNLFPGVPSIRLDAKHDPYASPPINRAQFNEILGVHDDETFREMLGSFVEMFPPEIENLAVAVATGESSDIRERAHRAKSAAANLAAPALTALLLAMENRARDGEVRGLPESLEEVRAEFRRIESYYDRMNGSS
jgi:NTE family protein